MQQQTGVHNKEGNLTTVIKTTTTSAAGLSRIRHDDAGGREGQRAGEDAVV